MSSPEAGPSSSPRWAPAAVTSGSAVASDSVYRFETLPEELLESVMSCMDPLEWPKFGRINADCRKVFQRLLNQYRFNLALNHMHDVEHFVLDPSRQEGPSTSCNGDVDDRYIVAEASGMTIEEKIQELKSRACGWATLVPRNPRGLGVSGVRLERTLQDEEEERRRIRDGSQDDPHTIILPDGRRYYVADPTRALQIIHLFQAQIGVFGPEVWDTLEDLRNNDGRPIFEPQPPPVATATITGVTAPAGPTIPLWPIETPTHTVEGRTAIYELQEGIFLFCDRYRAPLGGRPKPTHIRLLPLPTANPNLVKQITTESRDVGFMIADLTMDPTQDLIVVSEYRVRPPMSHEPIHVYHLLTLSTFEEHPLAADPRGFTSLAVPSVHLETGQLLQVMDDILAVLVSTWPQPADDLNIGPQELRIWNWKTGKLLLSYRLPPCEGQAGLVLLNHNMFLLALTRLEEVLPDVEPTASIEIYRFGDGDQSHMMPPKLLQIFLLPELADGMIYDQVDIRPDPPFPARAMPSVLGATKPFTEDPDKGLLSFGLRISQDDDQGPLLTGDMTLFVKKETLVDLAESRDAAYEREYKGVRGVNVESWHPDELPYRVMRSHEWMEEHSRLVDRPMSRSWVCYIAGYRFMSIFKPPPHAVAEDVRQGIRTRLGPYQLRMLDFDPIHLAQYRWAQAQQQAEGSDAAAARIDPENPYQNSSLVNSIQLHDQPTRIRNEMGVQIFQEDVKTNLPYLEVQSDHVFKTDGVMMDDQRVMLTASRSLRDESLAQDLYALVI